MRSLRFLLVLCTFATVILAKEETVYDDRYDFVDAEEILQNDRLRNQYYNCFLETGPCITADSKFFKEKFPEALITKCRKCTKKQRDNFEKIVLYYSEKEPAKWNAVLTKAVLKLGKS